MIIKFTDLFFGCGKYKVCNKVSVTIEHYINNRFVGKQLFFEVDYLETAFKKRII